MTVQKGGGDSGRACNLNSAKKLLTVGGEMVAVLHPHKATGYKAKNAHTKSVMEKSIMPATAQPSPLAKKLVPYAPNATRNRPKEAMENRIGARFGVHASTTTETYRGSSQLQLVTLADPDSKKPWKTTNQVFAECTALKNTTGLSNPGISSDVARRMHKRIGIYAK